jgi:TRAP-type C4-dicarboxylate transport system substrate-binding protein
MAAILTNMNTSVRWRAPLAALAILGAAAAAGHAQPRVELVVAGTSFRDTIGERNWLEFKRYAEERSGGALRCKMLVYGELGPEENIVSGLRRGRVQYANLSALVASSVVPEMALAYAPYLFDDQAQADHVIDSYLVPQYRKLFAARGLELITWYDLGFQQIWSRRKPILVPADGRGVRFRISSSKSAELLGRAMGADLIPLPFSEIIPSLQTGLIEAGENGVTLYARTGTAPEAPHLTLTDHSLAISVIVADKKFWGRLTPQHQKILRDAFPDVNRIRATERAEIARDLAGAQALRFKVHRLTPQQRALWAAATRRTHPELIRSIGGETQRLYDGIVAAKRAYAARSSAAQ